MNRTVFIVTIFSIVVFASGAWFPGDVDFGFYILPESISLLKPQIGDVVEHPSLGFWKITNFSEFQGRPVAQSNEDRSFLVTEIKSIIQRDGKPFFWPESA